MEMSLRPVIRPQWRRFLKPALVIGALVIVFAWVLPRFIDYEEVWDALAQLDAWELAVLVGLGLGRVPTEALMYRAFLPGLALRRGDEAYGPALAPRHCRRGLRRLPISAPRTHGALARGEDATAAVLDPGEVQARWTPRRCRTGGRAAYSDARSLAGGLGVGLGRRRCQPPRYVSDPARIAPIRRRLERRAVRTRRVRSVRRRLLGLCRFPVDRERSWSRRRGSTRHARRTQWRLRRRPGGSSASVARLLLAADVAARGDHVEPVSQGEPGLSGTRRNGCHVGRAALGPLVC